MDDGFRTKLPPQNTDAEASLLGAILIDSDAIVKVADAISRSIRLHENKKNTTDAHRLALSLSNVWTRMI